MNDLFKKSLWLCAFIILSPSILQAGFYTKPFESSILTPEQKNAWSLYVNLERNGRCEYKDDDRITNPAAREKLLIDILEGKNDEAVLITLRTYIKLSDDLKKLISQNMKIASMKCNNVYLYEGEMIGIPVISFEEALDILLHVMKDTNDVNSAAAIAKTFKVAPMDVRWFWNFFLVDEDDIRRFRYPLDTLKLLAEKLPNIEDQSTYDSNNTILFTIYRKLLGSRLFVQTDNTKCRGVDNEPSKDLWIDKGLKFDDIEKLYKNTGIKYTGKWEKKIVKNESGKYELKESKLEHEPNIPLFNVTRGLRIYPQECKK